MVFKIRVKQGLTAEVLALHVLIVVVEEVRLPSVSLKRVPGLSVRVRRYVLM